ncbi:hypothetical protein ACIA8G_27145 [Lentzea sp. NPDC051213]|uniref:hypothetical protein n=1 Tax=Lentzea sp. NPDC051213 TaxID=3364126 RepID=UPI00378E4E54
MPPPFVTFVGPVDPLRLLAGVLADVLAERCDQLDQANEPADLYLLAGLSASVEALREPDSPCFRDHVVLAIRSLEAAQQVEPHPSLPAN